MMQLDNLESSDSLGFSQDKDLLATHSLGKFQRKTKAWGSP